LTLIRQILLKGAGSSSMSPANWLESRPGRHVFATARGDGSIGLRAALNDTVKRASVELGLGIDAAGEQSSTSRGMRRQSTLCVPNSRDSAEGNRRLVSTCI
jgi:hypothetical protein